MFHWPFARIVPILAFSTSVGKGCSGFTVNLPDGEGSIAAAVEGSMTGQGG